jgi:hypothetical protein
MSFNMIWASFCRAVSFSCPSDTCQSAYDKSVAPKAAHAVKNAAAASGFLSENQRHRDKATTPQKIRRPEIVRLAEGEPCSSIVNLAVRYRFSRAVAEFITRNANT